MPPAGLQTGRGLVFLKLPPLQKDVCHFRILEATNDSRQVSTWLGHADQKTTEIDMRLDPGETLKIQSRQKQPEISAGRFEGVEDELSAALAKIKASSS